MTRIRKLWSFLNLEVWAPAWTVCERENRSPDVFLTIVNESLTGNTQLLFNPIVLLAVSSDVARQNASLVHTAVSSLKDLIAPKLLGRRKRPWGLPWCSGAFTNSIQDLAVSGLFMPGPRHKGTIGFHLFAEEWQPAVVEKPR